MPGGKKTAFPSRHRTDRRPSEQNQKHFKDVFQDPPESSLPQGSLSKVINAKCMGRFVRPRNGSTSAITQILLPEADRNNITLESVTENTLSFSDSDFSAEDVSYLIAINTGDEIIFTQITQVNSTTTVQVRDDLTNQVESGLTCWQQGRINLFQYHDHSGKYLIQLGTDLYWKESLGGDMVKALKVSIKGLQNAQSTYQERNEYAIIVQSGGVFEIKMDEEHPKYWKLNVRPNGPNERPDDVDVGSMERYRYLVSTAMIAGTGMFRTPIEYPYPLIHTETPPWYADDENQDYTEVSRSEPIGDGSVIVEGVAGAGGIDIDVLEAHDYGDFKLKLNGDDNFINYAVDLTGVISPEEVAEKLQYAIRREHPQATVAYNNSGFTIYASEDYNGTIHADDTGDYIVNGNESSIVNDLGFEASDRQKKVTKTVGSVYNLSDIYMPMVPNYDSITRQRHFFQYMIYRTLSIGEEGYHINDLGSRVGNSPDQFVLTKALRAAAVFVVVRRNDGFIEASQGLFELADVGSSLTFENGDEVEILSYDSDTIVGYDNSTYYNGGATEVCVLGHGRLIKGSQLGDTFTSTTGVFADDDEGAPVWQTDGQINYIKSVTDSNNAVLLESRDTDVTGLTFNPSHRSYNDGVYDRKLLSRLSWTCKARFFREMRPGNISAITSGFMFVGRRGRKEIQYCQLSVDYARWLGSCDQDNQKLKIDTGITACWAFPQVFVIWSKGKTYITSLVDVRDIGYNELGYNLFTIATPMEHSRKGVYNQSCITSIEGSSIKIITTDYEWVNFNGEKYWGNTAENDGGLGRMKRALKEMFPQYLLAYTDETGCLLWGKKK